MGTRCLTHVKDSTGETLLTIYRQSDGYPTGHGQELINVLGGGKAQIINGISSQGNPAFFNGMGCLAAHLVGALKEGIGGIYIVPPNTSDCWEDFTYALYLKDDALMLSVNELYDGKLCDFDPKAVEVYEE